VEGGEEASDAEEMEAKRLLESSANSESEGRAERTTQLVAACVRLCPAEM